MPRKVTTRKLQNEAGHFLLSIYIDRYKLYIHYIWQDTANFLPILIMLDVRTIFGV
jgi:hypothetical protein